MGKKWYQGNASSEFHANLYPFDCFFLFVCFWIPCICLEWKMHLSKWVQFMHGCVENLCSNQRSMMALLSAIFKILHISSSILFMIYVHLASGKCNQKYFYVYFNSMSSFVSLFNDLNNAMHFLKWYCEFNERTWTDVCIYFGNAGTWANIRWNKNALESCSGFDWNEEMEFRLSLSPNVHCAHLNAYSQ